MTTTQWILNLALLAWVLGRNLGTRPVQRSTFLTPLLLVVVASVVFLRDLPTAGHDLRLEAGGVALGALAGFLAAMLTRTRRRLDGVVVIAAGAAFAAVWVLAIVGRIAFAQWASGSGARTVGEFSTRHQITGADAWTAAFVLMALTMVLTRTAFSAAAVRATQTSRQSVSAPSSHRVSV